MLKDFKEFALNGSMVDMAVGIIMGAAFGTVISSLVSDLLMPIVSSMFNLPDFTNLFVVLSEPANMDGVNMASLESVREAGGTALAYGNFISTFLAFMLVAFALWMVIRGLTRAKLKAAEAAPGPTEVELLSDIKELLGNR